MADLSAHDSRLSSPLHRASWRQSPLFCYGFGLVAFGLAFAARWELNPVLSPGFPFLTFFPAVILTAFVAGLRPGILVAALSTVAALYFFVPPFNSFALSPESALALAFFVVIIGIDIAIIHIMQLALVRLRLERAKSARLAEQHRTLFTELQHRISNNLQVVSALLSLQKSSLSDKQARQALSDASQRLLLVSKLNRKLHDPDIVGLDLKEFLRELCHDVSKAAGIEDAGCNVKGAEGVSLTADKAVPLALIVAELLSNSIEHGFDNRELGQLRMDLERSSADEIVLTVQDNGRGLPAGFELRQAKSLGLRIVQSLANQIGARLEIFSDQGTTCRLTFAP